MKHTSIEWCDHTWSPWRGCTKVSPGCANCYAEKLSKRNPSVLGQWGKGKPRVLAKNWSEPVKWNEDSADGIEEGILLDKNIGKKRVFPSLCDWLDEEVPIEWLCRFLKLIYDTPDLDWLLLTKRPENFEHRITSAAASGFVPDISAWLNSWALEGGHPINVWVGTSVEDQQRADERIPALLKIPSRLRFLSVEPMLGEVELRLRDRSFGFPKHITKEGHAVGIPQGIDWVIIGGESGHGSRPCNVEWVRSLLRQCIAFGIPCFVKQLGARAMTSPMKWFLAGGREVKASKGEDPMEWPVDLRVRKFPEVTP